MNWPNTRLIDLLELEHPIIQAPMAGASTPSMAAASSNAGCLGSLGCAMMDAATYRKTYDETRALTNAPLNMNFFCHDEPEIDHEKNKKVIEHLRSYYDDFSIEQILEALPKHFSFNAEMANEVLRAPPAIVSFHFGLPELEIVEAMKEKGIKILSSATTVQEAKHLEDCGVDAIIAQGWEAGGHHGFYKKDQTAGIGTMALVPQLVDAVKAPVIAAGGIADGRGIAATFALGASGVQIGTAFLTCKESAIPSAHHKALMSATGDETELTSLFSGRPARGIKNRYMSEMKTMETELPDFPIMNTLTGPLRKASAENNQPDFIALWSGQSVSLNRECTVKDLIEILCAETFDTFKAFQNI